MNRHARILSFIALALLVIPSCVPTAAFADTSADCTQFTRNLKLGMSGQDVLLLQKVLNANPKTRISASGPGSIGMEVTYFGGKTRTAVMRFQEEYKSAVLTPVGLTKANGNVGALSRAKLTALCTSMTKTASVNVQTGTSTKSQSNNHSTVVVVATTTEAVRATSSPASVTPPTVFVPTVITQPWMGDGKYKTPEIMLTSDRFMSPGATYTIFGVGFTGDTPNTLHLDEKYTIKNLGVDYRGVITFVVPLDVPKGRHYIWMTNAKGEGNHSLFVIVPTPGHKPPVILRTVPSSGKAGDTITITGTGFSKEWNDILFPTKVVKGIASPDGTTLTFTIPTPDYDAKVPGIDLSVLPELSATYYVVNDDGVSGEMPFTVKFK
jgi:peptidoglycan hydrolase-like protein with peptidoglycan-binding domain